MDWARMLAYVTGTVDQELLARNEYLAAENRILKVQLNGRLKLSDATRGDPAKASSPKPAKVMSTLSVPNIGFCNIDGEGRRG